MSNNTQSTRHLNLIWSKPFLRRNLPLFLLIYTNNALEQQWIRTSLRWYLIRTETWTIWSDKSSTRIRSCGSPSKLTKLNLYELIELNIQSVNSVIHFVVISCLSLLLVKNSPVLKLEIPHHNWMDWCYELRAPITVYWVALIVYVRYFQRGWLLS